MTVYLDHAATTPLRQEVLEAMLPHMNVVGGNPSAMYNSARMERQALEDARARVAACIGAEPQEIFFTSGGTESNNWALRGFLNEQKMEIVATAAEHHSILEVCSQLKREGVRVSLLPVDDEGRPKLSQLEALLSPSTALLTMIYANNEVGTIAPIATAAALAREKGVIFHTDAVAAVGRIPIDVHDERIALLSASAHKFHGPQGVGFLYIEDGLEPARLLIGGRQERGRRAGSENIAGAVGLATALRIAVEEMTTESARFGQLRDLLRRRLERLVPGIQFNGDWDGSVPTIVNITLPQIRSEAALIQLDKHGIECGAGAACATGAGRSSHVLAAMGVPDMEASCALRLSFGQQTSEEDIEAVARELGFLVSRHRRRTRNACDSFAS